MLKKFSFVVVMISVLIPAMTYAQASAKPLNSILNVVSTVLGALVPIIIGLAIVYFMWGVVSYILAKSDETKKEGKNKIIYGFIALFILTSFWGVIRFLGTTSGIQQVGGVTGVNCLLDPQNPAC